MAMFIDIEGAYDNVIPSILIQDMLDMGIPFKTAMFVKEVIWSRVVSCRFNSMDLGTRYASGSRRGPALFCLIFI